MRLLYQNQDELMLNIEFKYDSCVESMLYLLFIFDSTIDSWLNTHISLNQCLF